jgi:predicted ATP-grasp superfamily ATP-dependent carboligase
MRLQRRRTRVRVRDVTCRGDGRCKLTGELLLLVAGISARALAVAARRAGLAAIAFDAFGDLDTREACRETLVLENAKCGFANVDLTQAVAARTRDNAAIGLVYGAGFDDCPQRLAQIETTTPILGSSPKAMALAKDPRFFARACADAKLAHPEIAFETPDEPSGWLIKRRGGSGGLHVKVGAESRLLGVNEYWQRYIEGCSVSLLFVRDSRTLTPIAWSQQWTAPCAQAPFRYGGAAGPIDGPSDLIDRIAALTSTLGVRGLASADFRDDGRRFWLLEINPRPGATLDLFDEDKDPLLARHLAAMVEKSALPPVSRSPSAAEIVYADSSFVVPTRDWPDWTADRPASGTPISRGSPICTVLARGSNLAAAKAELSGRAQRIRSEFRGDGE